ncbi:MAG TPA: hypothetical protein DCY35_05225 [Prolixibacteraceae bacterium]|nr:hypothetical protein [Prolixibacteraceae bacterium]
MKHGLIITMVVASMVIFAGLASATRPADVTTDKSTYIIGEDVTIYITNNGNDPYTIRGGYYVTTINGEPVCDPYRAIIWITILPGGTVTYHWNQTYANSIFGADGEQVTPGKYVVRQYTTPKTATIWIE